MILGNLQTLFQIQIRIYKDFNEIGERIYRFKFLRALQFPSSIYRRFHNECLNSRYELGSQLLILKQVVLIYNHQSCLLAVCYIILRWRFEYISDTSGSQFYSSERKGLKPLVCDSFCLAVSDRSTVCQLVIVGKHRLRMEFDYVKYHWECVNTSRRRFPRCLWLRSPQGTCKQ